MIDHHKTEVEELLSVVEKQIFDLEEKYYNETPNGNIMRGFDGFLDSRGPPIGQKRRMDPEHRWFSYSSWTFWCVACTYGS